MNVLKELRLKEKLTQQQVADMLNVGRTTYLKYESGALEPSNTVLVSLADFYGVTVDYLLGRESNIVPFAKKEATPKKKQLTEEEMMKLPLADGARVEREPTLSEKDFKVIAAHSETGGLTEEEKREIFLIAEEVYKKFREEKEKKDKK